MFKIIRRFIIYPLIILVALGAIVYTQTSGVANAASDLDGESRVIQRPAYTYFWKEAEDEESTQFTVHFDDGRGNDVGIADLPVRLTTNGANPEYADQSENSFVDFVNALRPAPEEDGYTFVGWHVGTHSLKNCKAKSIEYVLSGICERTEDLNLHAHYEPMQCNVTYKWTFNGIEQEHTETVAHGEPAPEFIPDEIDGTFLGWKYANQVNQYYGAAITENTIFYAIVEDTKPTTCTIRYNWERGAGNIVSIAQSYPYGSIPALFKPASSSPEVVSVEYYYDAQFTQKYVREPITQDLKLHIKFINKYDLFTEFVPVLHNDSTGTHSAGNFAFENDVAVAKDNVNQLVFRLKVSNPNYVEFSANTKQTYNFRVVRESKDGKTETVYWFTAEFAQHWTNNGAWSWIFTNNSNCVKGESVQIYTTIAEAEYNGWTYKSKSAETQATADFKPIFPTGERWDSYEYFIASDKTYLPIIHEEADGSMYVYLTINTANTTDRYSVFFDQGGKAINSYSASVYDVVNSLDDRNGLEDNFGDKADDASNVLESTTKTIVVKYLQDIPNTNFATSVKKSVDVVVDGSGKVTVSAVALGLGMKNFDALGSPCIGFEFDASAQMYVAKYLKNVWLSAKTVDGRSANYFLDCNYSYADYYGRLVNDGVFSQDLYDFVYAQILSTAPYYLLEYKPAELYGYWGYVVIPNTYTLDRLWSELFDTETSFSGVITNYKYTELLTASAYNKLLKEYQYPWFSRAWNEIVGTFAGCDANHYLFYAEIETTNAEIGENGGGDNGALENGVKEVPQKIINFVEKAYDWWENRPQEQKTLTYVLIGVVVVLFLVFGIAYLVTITKMKGF